MLAVGVDLYFAHQFAKGGGGAFNININSFNSRPDVTMKLVGNYNPGLVSAYATIDVMSLDKQPLAKVRMPGQLGPLIFKNQGWLNYKTYIPIAWEIASIQVFIDSPYMKMLSSLYGREDFYDFQLDFGLDKTNRGSLKLTPLKTVIAGDDLDMSATTILILHPSTDYKTYLDLSIPFVHYKGFSLNSIKGNLVVGVSLKHFSLKLNAATGSVSKNSKVEFSMSNIDTNLDIDSGDELGAYNFAWNIGRIHLGTDQLGPINIVLGLSNINEKIATKALEPPIDTQKLNLSPTEILKFLAARPGADLKLNFDTGKGSINVNVNAAVGNKDMTKIDNDSIIQTATVKANLRLDKNIAYTLLTQYLLDEIFNKEKDFFEKNETAVKNPYTFSETEQQAVIETWLSALLDNLRSGGYLSETDTQFSTIIQFDKNIITINDKQRTAAELDQLKALLDYTPAPAPAPAPSPTAVPTTSTTTTTKQ